MHNRCMTPSSRHLARVLLAAGVLTAAAPPAHAGLAQPAAAPASPPARPAPAPAPLERFVDRVWVVDASTSVAAGSLYVFLSDNALVISPKGGTPRLATWAEDVDGLVITEKGRSLNVAIVELTTERFRIRIATPKAPTEITLVPAITPVAPPSPPPTDAAAAATAAPGPAPIVAPLGAPYRCGGDTFRVAFEGDKAYLTWPDNTVLVLTETKVADSTASRRTYSDGQFKVVEDTSESFTRVFFARPGFRPRPCTSTR